MEGIDVEAGDKDKNTAMHVAASSEALESIAVLVAFNADLNARNKWGETPLMVSTKFGHLETTKLFIESYNADLFAINNENINVKKIESYFFI